MPFLNNLSEFLRTTPANGENDAVGLANKLLAAGYAAAARVVDAGHQVEGAKRLPRNALMSAVLSSGTWRAGIPPRDGEGLSLVRDLLVARGQFPAQHDPLAYAAADPEVLMAGIGDLARSARRSVVNGTLKVLVAEARAARATPRLIAEALEDQIGKTPRIFQEGDLVFRLLKLVL